MKTKKKTGAETSKKNASTSESSAKTSKSEEQCNPASVGKVSLVGPYMGCKSLDKEISEFCRRSEKRQKDSFGMSYDQGDDIRKMIALIEGEKYRHLRRRPNGTSPYGIICGHRDCRLMGEKQMRRYVLFADTVDAIKKAGYEAPILGLTYYVEGARLKSVESIVETLNQVAKDDLSVRELIDIVDQIMPPKKKAQGGDGEMSELGGDIDRDGEPSDWKKSLAKIIGTMLARLAPIAQEMADKKAILDKETADSLRILGDKIAEILRRAA